MAFSKAQTQAIMHKDGPMMVLAGPGSGKTTVITHRVQYLTKEYGIDPGDMPHNMKVGQCRLLYCYLCL